MPGDDLDLMSALAVALAPPPLAPSDDELARLRADLSAYSAGANGSIAARDRGRVVRFGSKGRLGPGAGRRLQHPIAAAAAVAVLATTGVAAAAVATDTLPGPTRQVATDLGLPVTSPGLELVRHDMSALQTDLRGTDAGAITRAALRLRADLGSLDPGDRRQVAASASLLLQQAATISGPGTGETPSGSSGGDGGTEPSGTDGGTSGTSGTDGGTSGTSGTDGGASGTSGSDGGTGSGTAGTSGTDGGTSSTSSTDGGSTSGTSGSSTDGGGSSPTSSMSTSGDATSTTTTIVTGTSGGPGPSSLSDGGSGDSPTTTTTSG